MAAWGYEFYLRVLKVSLSALEDIKFVSPSGHVISSIFRANLQKMKNDLITREFKNLNCHEIKKGRKKGKIEDVVDSKKKTETQSFLPYE